MSFRRECVWNVSVDIMDRIQGRDDWKLYVSDSFWALDMDGCVEFYFHPRHFLGKIGKEELPEQVLMHLDCLGKCFTPEDRKVHARAELRASSVSLRFLDQSMTTGNWFYAQGQNYVTVHGKFICDDPYYEGRERECNLRELSWNYVADMMKMTSTTRSHHYLRSLYDLPCFVGTGCKDLLIRPLFDFAWSAQWWKDAFEEESARIRHSGNEEARTILRYMRKEAYQHTVFLVRKGYYLTPAGKKVEFPDSRPMEEGTALYAAKLPGAGIRRLFGGSHTKVTVENIDCLLAAKAMQERGLNPAVLNMANRQTPGGGVYQGAGAQEENIFRRSNLFRSLYRYAPFAGEYGVERDGQQYPMDRNHGGAYSPDVVVFRGLEQDGYPLLEEPYRVSVISVAAMNRPELTPAGEIAPHLVKGVKNKIRTILNIGLRHGHDSLVLSAFGCGAFRNPPEHMAKLFHEVIRQEYDGCFREICFAIVEDHNSGGAHNAQGNYLPFYKEFGGKS